MNFTAAKNASKVVYLGTGRPELKKYKFGTVINNSSFNSSVLVQFNATEHEAGGYRPSREEWVGAQYLEPYVGENSYVTEAVVGLEAKKRELQSELDKVNAAITALKGL